MTTKAAMEKSEERNDDREEREADAESRTGSTVGQPVFNLHVQLGPSTPVPLEEGKKLAAVKARERLFRYRRIEPDDVAEDIVRVHQADQAHKDRDAERKRMLAGTRRETLKHVAVGAAVGALIEAGILIALGRAGIL